MNLKISARKLGLIQFSAHRHLLHYGFLGSDEHRLPADTL